MRREGDIGGVAAPEQCAKASPPARHPASAPLATQPYPSHRHHGPLVPINDTRAVANERPFRLRAPRIHTNSYLYARYSNKDNVQARSGAGSRRAKDSSCTAFTKFGVAVMASMPRACIEAAICGGAHEAAAARPPLAADKPICSGSPAKGSTTEPWFQSSILQPLSTSRDSGMTLVESLCWLGK